MSKYLIAFLFFGTSILGFSQKCIISGTLSGLQVPVNLILSYNDASGNSLSKELVVRDGKFEFTVEANASSASLRMMPYHPSLTVEDTAYWPFFQELVDKRKFEFSSRGFFLENGHITIAGKNSLSTASLVGGKDQALYLQVRKSIIDVDGELEPMDSLIEMNRGLKNDEMVSRLTAQKQLLHKKKDLVSRSFVEKNPDSDVSLLVLKWKNIESDPVAFETLLNTLSVRLRKSSQWQELAVRLRAVRNNQLGKAAVNFTINDVNDKSVSLSDFKGKYVLIDFWASWCGPCREENPIVIKAYNRFKDKKFDVLSVSIDDKRKDWIRAVGEDRLPWIQVSDLKGRGGAAALAYNVTAIPTNFLIDPNGIIIAKDLRGDDLEKELEKILSDNKTN